MQLRFRTPRFLGLLLSIGSMPAIAAWTTTNPTQVYYTQGCGIDAGKTILNLNTGSDRYISRTGEDLFGRMASISQKSILSSLPVQIYTLAANPTTTFQDVGDNGTCITRSGIVVLGISLDKPTSTSIAKKQGVAPVFAVRKIGRDALTISGASAIVLHDMMGNVVARSSSTADGQLLSIAGVKPGTYILRSGTQAQTLPVF